MDGGTIGEHGTMDASFIAKRHQRLHGMVGEETSQKGRVNPARNHQLNKREEEEEKGRLA